MFRQEDYGRRLTILLQDSCKKNLASLCADNLVFKIPANVDNRLRKSLRSVVNHVNRSDDSEKALSSRRLGYDGIRYF